eukprot:TRINITY_DN230_c0_g1_i1.p1 TRINITY_DN230_c0_g1~~TRINITY_DN230_c0_g1_i1.p1  ORF type:complete len:204 (+),score=45.15 TRINITY_DN230_c0_g1_i1:23-634(+)
MEGEERKYTYVWAPVGSGHIGLSPKPSTVAIGQLSSGEGCNVVVTILSEKEGANKIGDLVKAHSMEWVWLDIANANPPRYIDLPKIYNCFTTVSQLLDQGKKVLIHCAAGLHRTGMMSFCLLRYLGLSYQDALEKIRLARPITAEQVGEKRLMLGEVFLNIYGSREDPHNQQTIADIISQGKLKPSFSFPPKKKRVPPHNINS